MAFNDLPQYGVAIFAVGALVYIVKIFLNFIKNHLQHHTEIDEKLAEAVRELLDWLKYQNHSKNK